MKLLILRIAVSPILLVLLSCRDHNAAAAATTHRKQIRTTFSSSLLDRAYAKEIKPGEAVFVAFNRTYPQAWPTEIKFDKTEMLFLNGEITDKVTARDGHAMKFLALSAKEPR